jgi:GNAT superfamily N-acetyltransferase
MLPADLDPVFDLWLATWPGANRERAIRALTSDPRYLDHTFVAISEEGQLLATAHYWLRSIRDEGGNPQPVGCISHVTTAEPARRQGHARTLVRMAHEAILADGCGYALLFSSPMGLPLYEGMGYSHVSAPFWQGRITREKPRAEGIDRYTVTEHEVLDDPAILRSLSEIYDAYNASRPASMLRDLEYWPIFRAPQFGPTSWWLNHRNLAFLARSAGGEIVAYALSHLSDQELARREFQLDQVLTISEVGALPGHEAAIPALLSSIVGSTLPGAVGARAFLPREPQIEGCMRTIFGDSLHDVNDLPLMALPLAEGTTFEQIQAVFSAPSANFWQHDEF